jgi:hypothetical protein
MQFTEKKKNKGRHMKKVSLLLVGGMASCLFPLPGPGCGNGIEEEDESVTCFTLVTGELKIPNTEQIRDAIVVDFDNDGALDLVFIGNTLGNAEDVTFIQDVFFPRKTFSLPLGSAGSVEGASIAVHPVVDNLFPQVLVSHRNDTTKNFTRFSFIPEDNKVNEVIVDDPIASLNFDETLGIDSVDVDSDGLEEIIFATNLVINPTINPNRIAGIHFLDEENGLSFIDVGFIDIIVAGLGENIRSLEIKAGQLDADAGVEIVIADVDENDNSEIAIVDDFELSRINEYDDIEENPDLYQQIAMLSNPNPLRSLQTVDTENGRLGDIIAITQKTKEVMSFLKNREIVNSPTLEQTSLERDVLFRSVDTPRDLVVGEFDQTLGTDLAILENLSNGESRIVLIMNGDASNPKFIESFDGKAATINAADVNGDGRIDFVLTFESVGGVGEIGALIADF